MPDNRHEGCICLGMMRTGETGIVMPSFNTAYALRMVLALLLLAVALGPVCLLMTPAMAMGQNALSEDCNPSIPSAECPHAAASKALQPGQQSPQLPAAAGDVVRLDLTPATGGLLQPVLATPSPPVTHLTPLRL